MAGGDQPFNHGNLLGDVGDGAWLNRRGEQVQGRRVLVKPFGPGRGEFGQGPALSHALTDGFVIHIGHVSHVADGGAGDLEGSAEDILEDEGAEVSDMGGAIDGGTAAIDAEGARPSRGKREDVAGEGVEEADRHGTGRG